MSWTKTRIRATYIAAVLGICAFSVVGADAGATTPKTKTKVVHVAAPRCAHPNQDATVVKATPPDYPDSARDLGLGPVTVLVKVDVAPTGLLRSASIYKSSGNGAIDREALRAAYQSTFAPRYQNCKAVQGSYLFRTEFNPD